MKIKKKVTIRLGLSTYTGMVTSGKKDGDGWIIIKLNGEKIGGLTKGGDRFYRSGGDDEIPRWCESAIDELIYNHIDLILGQNTLVNERGLEEFKKNNNAIKDNVTIEDLL